MTKTRRNFFRLFAAAPLGAVAVIAEAKQPEPPKRIAVDHIDIGNHEIVSDGDYLHIRRREGGALGLSLNTPNNAVRAATGFRCEGRNNHCNSVLYHFDHDSRPVCSWCGADWKGPTL